MKPSSAGYLHLPRMHSPAAEIVAVAHPDENIRKTRLCFEHRYSKPLISHLDIEITA